MNPALVDSLLSDQSENFRSPMPDAGSIESFPKRQLENSESEEVIERFKGSDLDRKFDFDVERDVLVLLQIPKTGSTEMDQHLVWRAEVGERPDKCR